MNKFEGSGGKPERIATEFEDLRGADLSGADMSASSADNLVTSNFDTETKWPTPDKLPVGFDPEKLLENGKNPGLGLESLHKQGIDGRGVVVAIIDQKLLTGHKEYKDKIESYSEYGGAAEEDPSMHGTSVASLLVGENCGVAPGAELAYRAIPSGREFSLWAKALNDIIEKNKTAEPDKRIRVVSCSIGYTEQNSEPGLDLWINALKNAEQEGVVVVDVSRRLGIDFLGGGSAADKDDYEEYNPWLYLKSPSINPDSIVVPSDYRTMASWKGGDEYMYNGRGGISWSTPYLAGIFALVLQVNPDLTQSEVAGIINETAVINKKGLKIINPEGIVGAARKRSAK